MSDAGKEYTDYCITSSIHWQKNSKRWERMFYGMAVICISALIAVAVLSMDLSGGCK